MGRGMEGTGSGAGRTERVAGRQDGEGRRETGQGGAQGECTCFSSLEGSECPHPHLNGDPPSSLEFAAQGGGAQGGGTAWKTLSLVARRKPDESVPLSSCATSPLYSPAHPCCPPQPPSGPRLWSGPRL